MIHTVTTTNSTVTGEKSTTRLNRTRSVIRVENSTVIPPENYMTIEEFRKWGHDMVDKKFNRK
jgi:hypothetical protein